MANSTFYPNSGSLEDCLTNVFALADTYLLKWQRYKSSILTPMLPYHDPILSTFSKCLETGFLTAWRKIKIDDKKENTLSSVQELWIFWYGNNKPSKLADLKHPDLKDGDCGSWESGLSYECRTMFYKSLHNLIERHLLTRNYLRIDKYFVKPYETESDLVNSREHLSFTFSFFLHGDSAVFTSTDVARHYPIRRLTHEHLALASRSSSPVSVLLAPSGMKAALTGVSYKVMDDSVKHLLKEWGHFYPLTYNDDGDESKVPVVVEVIVGGVKMCYPSWFVLVVSFEDPLLSFNCKSSNSLLSPPKNNTTTPNSQNLSNERKRRSSSSFCRFHQNRVNPELCDRILQKKILRCFQDNFSPGYNKLTDESYVHKFKFFSKHSRSCKCSNFKSPRKSPMAFNSTNSSSSSFKKEKRPRICSVPFHSRSALQTSNDITFESSSNVQSIEDQNLGSPSMLSHSLTRPELDFVSESSTSSVNCPVSFNGAIDDRCNAFYDNPAMTTHCFSPNPIQPASTFSGKSVFSLVEINSQTLRSKRCLDFKSSQRHQDENTLFNETFKYFDFSDVIKNSDQIKNSLVSNCQNLGSTNPFFLQINVNSPNSGNNVHSSASPQQLPSPVCHSQNAFQHPTITNGNDNDPYFFECEDNQLVNRGSKKKPPTARSNSIPGRGRGRSRIPKKYSDFGPGETNEFSRSPNTEGKTQTMQTDSKWMTSKDLEVTPNDLDLMDFSDDDSPTVMANAMSEDPPLQTQVCLTQPVNVPDPVELTRMFPTPPSQEVPQVTSPAGADLFNKNSLCVGTSETSPADLAAAGLETRTVLQPMPHSPEDMQESAENHSQDLMSHVYHRPSFMQFVASNHYSSLKNLLFAAPEYSPQWIRSFPKFQANAFQNDVYQNPPSNIFSAFTPASLASQSPSTPGRASLHSEQPSPLCSRIPLLQGTTPRGGPFSIAALGESHSLYFNIYLSDTLLSIHRDVSFDSCVLCVCMLDVKGPDSIYLPGSDRHLLDANCVCGFSAVRNRFLAANAGLFYEDEEDILGTSQRKIDAANNSTKLLSILLQVSRPSALNLMGVIRDVCSNPYALFSWNLFNYDSSCKKPLDEPLSILTQHIYSLPSSPIILPPSQREIDGQECLVMAINYARFLVDSPAPSSAIDTKAITFHPWTRLIMPKIASNCNDNIAHLLQTIYGEIRDGIKVWDANLKLEGPLCWYQFHKQSETNAHSYNPQTCKPLPVPSILVTSSDQEQLSLSPYALLSWEKLMLEPFSTRRNVLYFALCPCDTSIYESSQTFFKEVSAMYATCKLGVHQPILNQFSKDGIIKLSGFKDKDSTDLNSNGWPQFFAKFATVVDGLHQYVTSCIEYMSTILLQHQDTRDFVRKEPTKNETISSNNLFSSSFSEKLTAKSESGEIDPFSESSLRDESSNTSNTPLLVNESSSASSLEDQNKQSMAHAPTIVVYCVDPFSFGTSSQNSDVSLVSSLAILKCFEHVLPSLSSKVKSHVVLQIVPLQLVVGTCKPRNDLSINGLLKSFVFSVFAKCRTNLLSLSHAQSMTGFGPAADREKKFDHLSQIIDDGLTKFTPPFILSNVHQHSNPSIGQILSSAPTENVPNVSKQQLSADLNILFVVYCLSHDQQWLLVSCTDLRGETLHTQMISLEVPQPRKKQVLVLRHGLTKVWEFVISVLSMSAVPWRVVIGRFGRIGHSEIKDWQVLLSKHSLQRYSTYLKQSCSTCSLHQQMQVQPSIMSVCLVSMESSADLMILPGHTDQSKDQVNTDRSSRAVASQLSTPLDVSATHILVIPTSAVSRVSVQDGYQPEPMEFGLQVTEELFGAAEFIDEDYKDIFDIDPPDLRANTSPSAGVIVMHNNLGHDKRSAYLFPVDSDDETSNSFRNLQQQPLSLGYYISTAPIGVLPRWFWTSNPQGEHRVPVVLKAALHITVTTSDESATHPPGSIHPLDSSSTCNVLRYVLEHYDALSWLNIDLGVSHDRRSCLPVHIVVLLQMYNCLEKLGTI